MPRNYSNWRAGNPKSTCWHWACHWSSNPSSGFHSTALRYTMWWAYQKAAALGALKVVHSSDELRHRHNSQEQNPDGWSLLKNHFDQHGWLETNLTVWIHLAQFHLFANGRTLKKGRKSWWCVFGYSFGSFIVTLLLKVQLGGGTIDSNHLKSSKQNASNHHATMLLSFAILSIPLSARLHLQLTNWTPSISRIWCLTT